MCLTEGTIWGTGCTDAIAVYLLPPQITARCSSLQAVPLPSGSARACQTVPGLASPPLSDTSYSTNIAPTVSAELLINNKQGFLNDKQCVDDD